MQNAIEITGLTKKYGDKIAVDNLNLTIKKGDFFAFLGHNGAGKTTTINILSSLVNKTSGNIKIADIDIDENFSLAKTKLGIVPQEFNFFMWNKVWDIVVDQAGFYGIGYKEASKKAEELLKKLDLWEKKDVMAMTLSGGMKRRLMIARGLVHNPEILLLDEPTAGVDVELRRGMWEFLTELNQQGVTIILTTHYLEEAEKLCKNMAIISKGKIVKQGSVAEILADYKQKSFLISLKPDQNFDIQKMKDVKIKSVNILELILQDGESLSEKLKLSGVLDLDILEIKPAENALEEILLQA